MKYIYKFIIILIILFLLENSLIFCFATNDDVATHSPSCLLIELSTGKILYEKNINEKMYPASTTKLMTAILAVEKCKLTDIATVSSTAISNIPEGYTSAYLREGEQFTIEQLLNVLLIPSANDAANVIAEHIAGSISSFADMMNKKAKELGCKNTNFTNPSGMHDENHYSTASDLAIIGQYALKNKTITDICNSTYCELPSTNKYSGATRVFYTTNSLLVPYQSPDYYYKYATGLKTGYTDFAKDCIVATASKDGINLLAVILGSTHTESGYSERFEDCHTLFNYGFDNYSIRTVAKENSVYKNFKVFGATEETKNVDLLIKNNIEIFLKNDFDIKTLNPHTSFNMNLIPPITKGETIGTITYTVDGKTYSSELIVAENVESAVPVKSFSKYFFIVFFVITLWICLKGKK